MTEEAPGSPGADLATAEVPAARGEVFHAVAVGVAAAVLLGLRAPIAMRQLWAEDGSVFLQAAIDKGPFRPFTDAYAGYFHTAPRAIAAVSSLAPLRAAAFTTWLGVALVISWCAGTVFYVAPPWLTSKPTRAVLALGLVLVPAMSDESLANAANLQFVLLFASLVVLIGTPRGRWARASGCALVAVTGLTTPLAVALVPFAAWRLWRRRPVRVDAVVVAWAAGVAIQLAAIAVVRPDRGVSNTLSVHTIVSLFTKRVVFLTFSPVDRGVRPIGAALTVVLVAVVAAAAIVAWHRGQRQRALLVGVVPLVGAAVYAFAGRRLALDVDLPPRYELFVDWCVLWAALVSLETLVTARRTAAATRDLLVAGGVVAVALAVAWFTRWQPDAYRLEGPSWGTSVAHAAQQCQAGQLTTVAVRIMPVVDADPGWFVHVPCTRL